MRPSASTVNRSRCRHAPLFTALENVERRAKTHMSILDGHEDMCLRRSDTRPTLSSPGAALTPAKTRYPNRNTRLQEGRSEARTDTWTLWQLPECSISALYTVAAHLAGRQANAKPSAEPQGKLTSHTYTDVSIYIHKTRTHVFV